MTLPNACSDAMRRCSGVKGWRTTSGGVVLRPYNFKQHSSLVGSSCPRQRLLALKSLICVLGRGCRQNCSANGGLGSRERVSIEVAMAPRSHKKTSRASVARYSPRKSHPRDAARPVALKRPPPSISRAQAVGVGAGGGAGVTPQMSFAYSLMVRSEEKKPLRAV